MLISIVIVAALLIIAFVLLYNNHAKQQIAPNATSAPAPSIVATTIVSKGQQNSSANLIAVGPYISKLQASTLIGPLGTYSLIGYSSGTALYNAFNSFAANSTYAWNVYYRASTGAQLSELLFNSTNPEGMYADSLRNANQNLTASSTFDGMQYSYGFSPTTSRSAPSIFIFGWKGSYFAYLWITFATNSIPSNSTVFAAAMENGIQ